MTFVDFTALFVTENRNNALDGINNSELPPRQQLLLQRLGLPSKANKPSCSTSHPLAVGTLAGTFSSSPTGETLFE